MDKLLITWENFAEYSSVPIEYRFVDCADVIPGKEAWGIKAVSSQDWFFRFHFPGNPVMPGVLVMETLQQTGLLIVTSLPEVSEKLMLFKGCKNMRMYNSVRPGDILNTHVILDDFKQGIANFTGDVSISRRGEEKELLACTMKFSIIIKSMIVSMKQNEKMQESELTEPDGGVWTYDYSNFGKYLADPQEYRFLDKAITYSNEGIGEKVSSSLDWYYRFDESSMPFGFIMESIMQTGVLIVTQREEISNPLMMFNDCDCLEIFSVVKPGDVLKTHVTMKSFRNGIAKYEGIAVVDDRRVCEMKFTLIHPDEIRKFSERLARRSMNVDAKR